VSNNLDKYKTGVYPKGRVDFGKVASSFISCLDRNTGSAVSFLGASRLESADGRKKIKYLVMESYENHANKKLRQICEETKKKYHLNQIIIVHALGKFKPGEPVVLVAISSARRKQSLMALESAVERYKKEPALFKQEIYLDGTSKWIA
jgi:molybdopterin synthase catalytic subunit